LKFFDDSLSHYKGQLVIIIIKVSKQSSLNF